MAALNAKCSLHLNISFDCQVQLAHSCFKFKLHRAHEKYFYGITD